MSPAFCIIEISFLTLHEEQEKQSQRWTQASDYADAEVNERFTHCSALHKGNQTVTANHIHFTSAANNGVAVGAVHPAIAALCRGGGCGGGACVAAVRSDGNHLISADDMPIVDRQTYPNDTAPIPELGREIIQDNINNTITNTDYNTEDSTVYYLEEDECFSDNLGWDEILDEEKLPF